MANKKTKREHYNELRILANGNDELIEFIDHEIELLNKKNSAERKPTTNQLDNVKIKKLIKIFNDAEKMIRNNEKENTGLIV